MAPSGHLAVRIVAPDQYRRTPWKNGGGVAIDIADAYRPGTTPGDWTGMVWRLGRTAIERPGPFSDLCGYDRIQAVVAGSGLTLRASHGPILDLVEPFRPVRFPGEWAIASELDQGPVQVLNLIGDRAAVALDLGFVLGPAHATAPAGEHVLYAPTVPASVSVAGVAVTLAHDHAARFVAEGPVRIAVASGLVALASVMPRQP